MPHLNLKFAALLLAGVLAAGAIVHGLHGLQVRRQAGSLLDRATRAEQEGLTDRALHLLQRFILFKPDSADARVRFGGLLEARGLSPAERRVVMAVYEQALRRDPGLDDLRRRVARLAAEIGDADTALGHLDFLEKSLAKENKSLSGDNELSLIKARCLEVKKNPTAARGCYRDALEAGKRDLSSLSEPDARDRLTDRQVEAYVRLAGLLRRDPDERQRADDLMDEMKKHVGGWRASIERAAYLMEFKKPVDQAAADVAEALKLAPKEPRVLLLASQVAHARNQPAEARAHLERGLKLQPRSVPLHLALAKLDFEAGKGDLDSRLRGACASLRRGLKEMPRQPDLLAALADLLIQASELDEARATIALLRKTGAPAADLMFLDARALAREAKWADAARLLEDVRPHLVRSPELVSHADRLLGTCYQQLNDDRQMAVFRRAAGRDAEDAQAAMGLANALLYSGRVDEAAAEYERLLRLPKPPTDGLLMLARVRALQYMQMPAKQRDWPSVHKVLDEAEKYTPGDDQIVLLRAEVLAAEADNPDLDGKGKAAKKAAAWKLLEDRRRKDPNKVDFAVALAGLAAREADGRTAFRVLDEAERAAGDSFSLRLTRARLARHAPGKKPAAVLADAERGADNFSPADRTKLMRGLAEVHYALGSTDDAMRLGEEAAKGLPGELRIQLLLFDAAQKGGADEPMKRYLDRINAISHEGPLWQYARARYLVWLARNGDRSHLEEAHQRLNEVGRRRATWSRVPLCRANAFELEEKFDEAIDNYQMALTLGDRQVPIIERLVQLLYKRGRYPEAEQALGRLQALSPISPDLQRVAVDALLQKPDFDRARALAEEVVKKDSKNYMDQLWLAKVLFVGHKREEAEVPLLRAVELASGKPEPWVALVEYRVAMGRADLAREAITQARGKLPPAEAPLALAHCYEAVKDAREAEVHYRQAVDGAPESPVVRQEAADFYLRSGRSADALPHLEKLHDPRTKAPKAVAEWAGRELARALSATGNYRQFKRARDLVGGDTEGAKRPLAEHRARALVLAAHPAHREDALAEFRALARRAPLSAQQQFLLAGLLDADNKPAEARKAMQDALGLDPRNKSYLTQYALLLLRQGRRNDAARAIESLREQGAWDFDTVSLRARVLAMDGGAEELVKLVAEFVARNESIPKEPSARRVQAARLLDELGQSFVGVRQAAGAAADGWYRQYVSMAEEKEPECRLTYAGFLGRQGRAGEALDQCEQALGRCPPGRVAAACIVSLQSAHAGREHYARAERWLAELARKSPVGSEVLEALACAREQQERYPEAERLYRDLLAREPGNVVALNNLAYLLALRGQATEEALDLARRAEEAVGPLAEILDTRAVVLLSLGKADDAAGVIRHAQKLKAMPPSVTFHLARAESKAGREKPAESSLREAVKAGLKAEDLHPLERPAFAEMREKYGVR